MFTATACAGLRAVGIAGPLGLVLLLRSLHPAAAQDTQPSANQQQAVQQQ
ncbi:MAG: hypothetical protein ABWY00_00890 [Dongiaceae bacterium]